MDPRTLSHTIGFDDAPFPRRHRGDVLVVGAAFSQLRFEGVVSCRVRRDGRNATDALATAVGGSKFAPHVKVVLLQGIALAGFNVVDIHRLAATLARPVIVVMRRLPRLDKVRRALLERTRGGAAKWALIEAAGAPEPIAGVWVQRAGIDLPLAGQLVASLQANGWIPEPLRVAHLIAGGVTTGESRGRA
ncbi:MAG TPA: DUF99 family protein [Haliangiales bacterium]|nr:DUF99 family protein [Haliangiales bacterium]